MDDLAIARALHVLGVVLWIGGVAMVTLVILPAVRRLEVPERRIALFEAVEGRFAGQAKLWTVLTGLSGLYLVIRFDLWERFLAVEYWWMHAMVLVWAVFSVILFVAEPLFLHRWFAERAKREPEGTLRLVERFHRVLLTISLITIAGAVVGSHGWAWW
jgi:uncharacterized membrane protein